MQDAQDTSSSDSDDGMSEVTARRFDRKLRKSEAAKTRELT